MMRKRNASTTTTSAEVLPSSSSLSPGHHRLLRPFPEEDRRQCTPLACFIILAVGLLVTIHIYLAKVAALGGGSSSLRFSNDNSNTIIQWPPKNRPMVLTPLRPIDYEQYTIRINTWKRNEQLIASIRHHMTCPGVAQIQVIWCNPDEAPPDEITHLDGDKVVIERHSVNTLNERFHILSSSSSPTLGILSIDDDVLRPCEAIDAAFFRWLEEPSRILGFDGRSHVVNDEDNTWQYGYMSTTERENKYSIALTRYCFLHRDYLDWYMTDLPRPIFDKVAKELNCEDIAMSFMVSSLTGGKPPMIADFWIIKSMVKMYSGVTISGNASHKRVRDECVDSFAEILGLKEGPNQLTKAQYTIKNQPADCSHRALPPSENEQVAAMLSQNERKQALDEKIAKWCADNFQDLRSDLSLMMKRAALEAYKRGLIEGSSIWKETYGEEHARMQEARKKAKNGKQSEEALSPDDDQEADVK